MNCKAALVIGLLAIRTLGAAVDVEVQATPREVQMGDRITLVLTVSHDEGLLIEWPPESATFGPFEVLERESLQGSGDEGRTSVMRYALAAFELGELEIPSLTVGWRPQAGGPGGILQTNPVAIRVKGLEADPEGDIRDIKPPLEMPRDWMPLILWGVAGLALAAAGYWIYRRWRHRSTQPQPGFPKPSLPPHLAAHQALDELESSDLLRSGRLKEYYTRVSEIIRLYIEACHSRPAMEMTTSQILAAMGPLLGSDQEELLRTFLNRSDIVKFAKARPPEADSRAMIAAARNFVDATYVRVPERTESIQEVEKGQEVKLKPMARL